MFVVNTFLEHLFAKIHPFFHLVTFKSSNLYSFLLLSLRSEKSNSSFFPFCSAHAVIILSTSLPACSPAFTKPPAYNSFATSIFATTTSFYRLLADVCFRESIINNSGGFSPFSSLDL